MFNMMVVFGFHQYLVKRIKICLIMITTLNRRQVHKKEIIMIKYLYMFRLNSPTSFVKSCQSTLAFSSLAFYSPKHSFGSKFVKQNFPPVNNKTNILLISCLTSSAEIVNLYGDSTVIGERLQNVGLYLANWRIPSHPLSLFPVPLQGRSVLDHRGP